MAEKVQIIKIARTDVNVDNSKFEIKEPYKVKDDYGTEVTFYRKLSIDLADLLRQKADFEKALLDINEKIETIGELNKS